MDKTYEIKWGLGWIPRIQKPIKMFHVVVDGRTIASFTSESDANDYIVKRYGHVPLGIKS